MYTHIIFISSKLDSRNCTLKCSIIYCPFSIDKHRQSLHCQHPICYSNDITSFCGLEYDKLHILIYNQTYMLTVCGYIPHNYNILFFVGVDAHSFQYVFLSHSVLDHELYCMTIGVYGLHCVCVCVCCVARLSVCVLDFYIHCLHYDMSKFFDFHYHLNYV